MSDDADHQGPSAVAGAATGALTPLSGKVRANFAWLDASPVRKIVGALAAAASNTNVTPYSSGDVIRFVGGCVRDSLIGVAPHDIDAATILTPDKTIAALEAAGLAAHPTGVEHGTVTAVADGAVVEVTSLRADVSTDGRRAIVTFTEDWALDAMRRDFTINALYMTPNGDIYDPVGGQADLAAGRVRFIGEPDQRIKEDFLRILRFFRFSARFAADEFDAEGLSACARLKDGVTRLSPERIGAETAQILSLRDPKTALTAMTETGVLEKIYPRSPDLPCAIALKRITPDASAPLMLAALWGAAGDDLQNALRLSGVDEGRRSSALNAAAGFAPDLSRVDLRAYAYRTGMAAFKDGLHLAQAAGVLTTDEANGFAANIVASPPPVFPLSGRDVVKAGVSPGPRVGAVLKMVEERWIREGFPADVRLAALLAETVTLHR
ncbi:MAG: CCA tRNA nucleotidyltransferase [Pseudomonadota bacterium]